MTTEGGRTLALYRSQWVYGQVQAWCLQQLAAPGWTNNGFDMGPFGGSSWEFTSAEGDDKVLLSSERGGTKITFSHPSG